LNTAQVFTYWRADITDPGVERVLNYIDGDPAITAHALGEGRVVFFSTSANADWTTLPAKPAYVTLVHELLAGSVRTTDAWMNLAAGSVLELPGELKLAGAPTLTDAAGQNMPLELAADAGGAQRWRSRPLMRCGLYTLSTGAAQYPVAVNPPAQEADVRTLEESALRRALGDVAVEFHGDTLPPPADQQSGGDFGWPLMFAVLLLAGVESIAAWRFGHYRRS